MDIDLYSALLDETWRFNAYRRKYRIHPTIYRAGKTYVVTRAFIESDVLWYHCFELVPHPIHVHTRVPFVRDVVIHCESYFEWEHLMVETGVERNPYFLPRSTRKLSNPLEDVQSRKLSSYLTN